MDRNETSADSSQGEFDAELRLAILDALAGRLRHEILGRLAAAHENDTVRFCLRRLADPSLDAAEENLLVGLLMRSRQVNEVLARLSELAAGSAGAFGILFKEAGKSFETRLALAVGGEELARLMRALDLVETRIEPDAALPFLLMILGLDVPRLQSKAAVLIAKRDAELIYANRLMRHPVARVRANALEAMLDGGSRILDLLRLAAADPDSRVRTLAGVGLCRLGEPSGESVLLEAVRSPEPKLRRAGVWGLGMAARHDFEPILERLAADDPDLEVRLLAGQVLRGAGGRPRLDTT